MHTAHVVTRWLRGGTELNVSHSVAFERAHGIRSTVVVGDESDVDAIPGDLSVVVVPGLRRAPSPTGDPRAYRALRRTLEELAPDVVHTHQSKAGVLGRLAARKLDARVVHTVHMPSFHQPSQGAGDRAFLLAERACARSTDLFVAVGHELVDRYRAAGIGRDKEWLVIRSPVDVDRFAAVRGDAARRSLARASRGLVDDDRVIVTVGALEPRKRHALLIERLAPVLAQGATLLVAGDGPEAPRLAALADDLGVGDRVRFLGHVEALADVLCGSDCLVHAAAAEGVPQVVLQALAAGLPVAATACEGLDEVNGASIRQADPSGADLARLVEDALAAPPAAVSLSSLEPWRSAAVSEQLRDLYARLGVVLPPPTTSPAAAPAITVVIPTHQRPGLLDAALASVATQTVPPVATVVVDDAADRTAASVVARHAKGLAVSYLTNPGSGVASSRNLGLEACDTEVVAFLDDDDYWHPRFLEVAGARLVSTGVDAVVAWTQGDSGEALYDSDAMRSGLAPADVIAVNPGFTGSNVLYRAGALRCLGGFDPDLPVSNDKDLLVRFLRAGRRYATVTEQLSVRRTGDGPRLGTGAERVEGMGSYLRKHGSEMSSGDRRYLRGRMARTARRDASGLARIALGARAVVLLGLPGLRRVRADDRRTRPPGPTPRRPGLVAGG